MKRSHTTSVPRDSCIEKIYALACERYAQLGVDTAAALRTLAGIPISLHCWQGDDVRGFEGLDVEIGGGLAITGSYPGRARTPGELRSDLERALKLIPGRHRISLHAMYGDFPRRHIDRDEIEPGHFQNWIEWAKQRKLGLDFNPTFFAHPKAADGYTLAHRDKDIRRFWVEHGVRCRQIGAAIGRGLGTACITNLWIPDGEKDSPADRWSPRERLTESLDLIFRSPLPESVHLDAVEPKLFGLGSESYVVGSYEFYLGYAITRRKLLCLDAGHFHPTETLADKVSSVLNYVQSILLHLSRGVRWDSDHVITLSDDLMALMQEVVRGGSLSRVHFGLDYFDASINRVAAWVLGARNAQKALLAALLEPTSELRRFEAIGDRTSRLILMEELKTLPMGAVWDYFCLTEGAPPGDSWSSKLKEYERRVQRKRKV